MRISRKSRNKAVHYFAQTSTVKYKLWRLLMKIFRLIKSTFSGWWLFPSIQCSGSGVIYHTYHTSANLCNWNSVMLWWYNKFEEISYNKSVEWNRVRLTAFWIELHSLTLNRLLGPIQHQLEWFANMLVVVMITDVHIHTHKNVV